MVGTADTVGTVAMADTAIATITGAMADMAMDVSGMAGAVMGIGGSDMAILATSSPVSWALDWDTALDTDG